MNRRLYLATRKGIFIASGDGCRRTWTLSEPSTASSG